MSDNLNVVASLSAHDEASPVILGLLANVRKLEQSVKRFNSSFAGIGRAGTSAMASFSRVSQDAAANMRDLSNSSRTASRSYSTDWRRAGEMRLSDARRMYASLERMEAAYQRQLDRRIATEHRADRRTSRVSGSVSRLPAPRLSTIMIGGAALSAGIGSAFKKRIETEAAETRAAMFGELSKKEIETLRGSFADRAGIKYGVGSSKAIDAAVEGLKAGIAKEFAGEFADLALKAQAGLDIDAAGTAKLLGRLTTLKGSFNGKELFSILNAVAVANNATAADGNEIVEALRRSLSAMTSTKMTAQELAAFNASAISIGTQPFKAGTFMSFITSELANAGNAKGQRAVDLSKAANALGFGGRSNLSAQMIQNPTQTLLTVFERLMKLPEAQRTKVTSLIAQREWRDELLSLASARDLIAKTLSEIAAKPGFLDETSLKKIKSLQGRWASISAAFSLVWEKVGAGFETAFDQISDAMIRLAGRFNFNTVRNHFAALIDGFRQGFGLKNWGEAVESLARSFDAGTIAKWQQFGKGFAEGIREFVGGLKSVFSALAFIAGKNPASTQDMGNLAAKLTGLAIALAVLSPTTAIVIALAGAFTALASSPIGRIVAGLGALVFGIHRVLSYVADRVFSVFVSIVDAIKNTALTVINTVRGWLGLQPIGSARGGASGLWGPASGGASGNWSPMSQRAARSFAGQVTPARFPTGEGLNSAEYSRMFAGTPLADQQGRIAAAAQANGIPPSLLAAVIAHETGRGNVLSGNNPGGIMDPATGFARKKQFASLGDGIDSTARTVAKNYQRAGGDFGRLGSIYAPVGAANDPRNLNGGWAAGVSRFQSRLSAGGDAGSAGSGDAVSVTDKFLGQNEYRNAAEIGSFIKADPRGAANAWCARFVNASLEAVGGKGTGSAVANSFQRWGSAVTDLSKVQRGDVLVQPNGLGPDQPGGHVGFATGRTRMVNGRLQLEMRSGNDGDSVRDSWRDATKLIGRRGATGITGGVPSAQDVIQNVPQGGGSAGGGMVPQAMMGPAQIHINGGSHDPETLATLVQRRINESMNWRTHDIESEMT